MNGPRDPSPGRSRRQVNGNGSSRPLLDTETINPAGPPLAGPETDEELDDRETTTRTQPGVDDGFFTNEQPNPDVENVPKSAPPDVEQPDGRYPGRHPEFPYAPGYGPGVISVPDYAPTEFGGERPESIPDVNMYQHKKTLAQGMMDLALFSANANQLRYVLESFDRHPYYYPSVFLIGLSLIIQVKIC